MVNKFELLLVFLAFALIYQSGMVVATTFTLVNKCDYTVWPGILSNAGVAEISVTGFALRKGESKTINPPASWAGRFWGRTLCATNATTGEFICQTGDCGSGKIECAGGGAAPPATLAEFTLDGSGGQDFYDVSLVDGYNLPLLVAPQGGAGPNCSATACAVDLNGACPSELRVASGEGGASVACRSACDAFNEPQYCCSGSYGTPDTCKPSSYSRVFKKACPSAYSYAYDDKSSTFICGGAAGYAITFCPSPTTSQKAASSEQEGQAPLATPTTPSTELPVLSSTMVYEGALDMSDAASSPYTWTQMLKSHDLLGIGFLTAFRWLWPLWMLLL